MNDAIKKLHDYLAKSPSVVYPEDVLAYLPAIEAENAKLRKVANLISEYISYDRCDGCVVKTACNSHELDVCWMVTKLRNQLRELGVNE